MTLVTILLTMNVETSLEGDLRCAISKPLIDTPATIKDYARLYNRYDILGRDDMVEKGKLVNNLEVLAEYFGETEIVNDAIKSVQDSDSGAMSISNTPDKSLYVGSLFTRLEEVNSKTVKLLKLGHQNCLFMGIVKMKTMEGPLAKLMTKDNREGERLRP